MRFHVQTVTDWHLRVHQALDDLEDECATLRAAGATDAEIAVDRGVIELGDTVVNAYMDLLRATGSEAQVDVLKAEGTAMRQLDPAERSGALEVVQAAVRVEWRRRQYADNRPALQPAQGWQQRMLRVLWRVLLILGGTSLIDLAAALGFPPYQGMVQFLLTACHWLLAAVPFLVRLHGMKADSFAIFGLVAAILLAAGCFCQELSARGRAVAELEQVEADAAALVRNLPAAAQLASLQAALAAWRDGCTATRQHDETRLTAVRNRLAFLRLI